MSLFIKASLLGTFLASVLFVHFRGRARLPLLRQMVNYSALFMPHNALMQLFSGIPLAALCEAPRLSRTGSLARQLTDRP